jgi:hypothetical protein
VPAGCVNVGGAGAAPSEGLWGRGRPRGGARAALAGAVGGLALVLAACGSSPSAHRATTTVRRATSTTGGTSTTSGAPTSTSAASGSHCPASQLAGSQVGSEGAAGTVELTFALRNTGTTSCVLEGYPGGLLLDGSGQALPTTVERGGTLKFEAVPVSTVTLAPGATAWFNLGFSDVPTGTETSCPAAASLEITPPNAYDHLTVPASGLAPCGQGTVTVSPVFGSGPSTQTTAPPGP